MKCPHCSEEIPDFSTFCFMCGMDIETPELEVPLAIHQRTGAGSNSLYGSIKDNINKNGLSDDDFSKPAPSGSPSGDAPTRTDGAADSAPAHRDQQSSGTPTQQVGTRAQQTGTRTQQRGKDTGTSRGITRAQAVKLAVALLSCMVVLLAIALVIVVRSSRSPESAELAVPQSSAQSSTMTGQDALSSGANSGSSLGEILQEALDAANSSTPTEAVPDAPVETAPDASVETTPEIPTAPTEPAVKLNDFPFGSGVYAPPTLEQQIALRRWIEECCSRRMTPEDIQGFDEEMSWCAINTIYARCGRIFTSEKYQGFFSQFNWYNPTISGAQFTDELFTSIEQYNVDLMASYQVRMGYR